VLSVIGGFKGDQAGHAPKLSPSKFQERPFGMHENIYGELTALPQTRSWWGRGWLPPPRLHPRSLHSDPFGLSRV